MICDRYSLLDQKTVIHLFQLNFKSVTGTNIYWLWIICLQYPVSISLLHLSLFFLGTAAGVLILVNLLAQSGDLVSQVFQLSLYLLHTLRSGQALCSCCLTDARGIREGRRAQGGSTQNKYMFQLACSTEDMKIRWGHTSAWDHLSLMTAGPCPFPGPSG